MLRLLAAAATLVLSSTLAQAHPGDATHSLLHGFAHPIGGLDHALAMVAVGLLAFQLGGRALWLVPGAFVTVMAAGAVAGAFGLVPPLTEIGIAASVLVLGAAVALRLGVPATTAALVVGAFAIFHGAAHGAEMPQTAAGLAYGVGFVLATALLHACGISAGLLVGRLDRTAGHYAVRSLGAATAVVGGVLTLASL
ncbi:MAG TPA: HupE/UreJ family protein [Xanthobacteraceae bacterium]|nr:HupE/UreJ family protein [Xanthobacteraceae bacterium]